MPQPAAANQRRGVIKQYEPHEQKSSRSAPFKLFGGAIKQCMPSLFQFARKQKQDAGMDGNINGRIGRLKISPVKLHTRLESRDIKGIIEK